MIIRSFKYIFWDKDDIIEALLISLEEGIELGKIEMIKDLIRAGAEIELIVKTSKLSREEIEKIKREMED